MYVIVDVEWIQESPDVFGLTQLAAMRVNNAWDEINRFESVIHPSVSVSPESEHVALNGYPIERFKHGETEPEAIKRFSEWLSVDDIICVWHYASRDILKGLWKSILNESFGNKVVCMNHKVLNRLHIDRGNPYSISEEINLPVVYPQHCAINDVLVMRQLFCKMKLPQKMPSIEVPKVSEVEIPELSLVQRNRDILERVPYNYIYLPNSEVFHTRDCFCVLRAKKIEGSIFYKTASKNRRPCRICNPQPGSDSQALAARQIKQDAKKTTENYNNEIITVRVLGGSIIDIRRGKIIGFCHNKIHPGKLTKAILKEHECLEKQCRYLEKYEDRPFWIEREKAKLAKAKSKQQKKEKRSILLAENESMLKMRDNFQAYADRTNSEIDIIRVEKQEKHTYVLFYVSDNPFADGNRFPDFLTALRGAYNNCRIILRHIKDVDGHFITRNEFYSRKR